MCKTMLKKILFSLCLFSMAAGASASILTINYTGLVFFENNTNGSNSYDFGVNVGDLISGTFNIDLANLPPDIAASSNRSSYWDSQSSTPYQTEFVSETNRLAFDSDMSNPGYRNYDHLYIENDYSSSRDRVFVRDYDYFSSATRYEANFIFLDFYDVGIDFLDNVDLSSMSFSLNEAQLAQFDNTFGRIYIDRFDRNDVAGTREFNFVDFRLTSVNARAQEVSSPAALGLFGLSLLFVGVRRFNQK